MGAFYKPGEVKKRPGAYRMITNRGSTGLTIDADPFAPSPEEPDTPSSENVRLADRAGVLLKTADGKYLAVKI